MDDAARVTDLPSDRHRFLVIRSAQGTVALLSGDLSEIGQNRCEEAQRAGTAGEVDGFDLDRDRPREVAADPWELAGDGKDKGPVRAVRG